MPLFTTLIDLVFPPLCVHCGREGQWLCSAANTEVLQERVLTDPLSIQGVDRVIVRGSYDCEPLAQLVQKLKYHYWTGVSSLLQTAVEPLPPILRVSNDTVIIPVPLHGRRLRERGFNQSDYISRALSKITSLPISHLLVRTRYTPPQVKLSAQERTTNIIGAFDPSTRLRTSRWRISEWPKSVILVDDVITTGSTVAECAAVLRKHGVKKITAVAIAKG